MKLLISLFISALCLVAQIMQQVAGTTPVPASGGGINLLVQCLAKGTLTCTIDTTGATLIVVGQLTGGSSTLGAAPTENKSNTFQIPAATTCALGTSGVVQIYYIFNPTVGSGHIFTGHAASNGYFVSAYSGTLTTSAVYVTGNCHSQAGGGGVTFQPGSVTPTNTNQLIFSLAFDIDSGSGTWTVPSSFSLLNSCTSGCFSSSSTAYYVNPSSSAINPTWTNVNNQNFVGDIAVFDHP